MKKTKRNIKRWITGLILFFMLVWILAFIMLHRYKDVIRELTVEEINHHIVGNATLGDISVTFFSTFPFPSVGFDNVLIRDTMWHVHQQSLFDAQQIKIYFEWLSLFRMKPKVSQVVVNDAIIHLYTDSCGYSNLIEITNSDASQKHTFYPEFRLNNTRIIIENRMNNALHDIDAHALSCSINQGDDVAAIHLTIKSHVHGIGFNLYKGSYLAEKPLKGNLYFTYEPKKKIELKEANLHIDNHPVSMQGTIFLDTDTLSYDLILHSKQITYQQASSLLTRAIQQNIKIIDILDPMDIEANVAGKMAPFVIPRIKVLFIVKEAGMETPIGHLDKSSFTGVFYNQVDPVANPGDANSTISLDHVSAVWNNFSMTSNKIEITNLLNPVLDCQIASTFPMAELNNLSEMESLKFLKGTGSVNVMYQGSLAGDINILPFVNGTISFQDAELHYIPRELLFKKCSGELVFKDQELIMKSLTASVGQSVIDIKGRIENLLTLLNQHPEKLTMDLSLSSSSLNLGDFISYARVSAPSAKKEPQKKTKISKVINNIEKMLQNGTAKLNISAGELRYKKFVAHKIKAAIFLETNKVTVKEVSLQYAKGSASMKGSLVNGSGTNKLKMETNIQNMDIPILFSDFDNFGQDAVTAANTKGSISSKIVMSGEMTDKAVIKENSMHGTVDFSVKKGELNQFAPMMKLTEEALKNRDFSQIKFAELRNKMRVEGSAYHIEKMEIRSNVAVLFIEGVYDQVHGTDMSIQVPVTTITNYEHEYAENKGKVGVNIRLRAKTGEDGKLKVTWDPLNKAGKQRKAASAQKESQPASGKDQQQ